MFKNVLVGVDGRPNGRDAIALASRSRQIPRQADTGSRAQRRAAPDSRRKPGDRQRGARSLGAAARSGARHGRGRRRAHKRRRPHPGRGLHVQAEAQGADLLVVGSCSHGAIGRAMLGDDTRAALNGAPCAVAIASLGYAEHPDPVRQGRRRDTTGRPRARRRSPWDASSRHRPGRACTPWKYSRSRPMHTPGSYPQPSERAST